MQCAIMPNCADAFHVVVFGQLENILWAKYTIARVVVPVSYTHLDVYKRQAGTTGHGHFARGIGHAFQHVVQVLGNGFQVGFGAGCQQQVCLLYTSRCV